MMMVPLPFSGFRALHQLPVRVVVLGFGLTVLTVLAAHADSVAGERGAGLYHRECARCHGADLKGEPGWQTIGPDGRTKAPAHDESGHSWMHSEADLFQRVKTGMADVLPPGRVSDMPAYDGRLSDDDIRAVLAFIQSRWPPGHRAYQLLLDPNLDPARLPPGDWQLPKTCLPAPEAPAGALPPQ